jgi:phospholipase C
MTIGACDELETGACAAASLLPSGTGANAQMPQGLDRLSHIVVVCLENPSFDDLFGEFPRADGSPGRAMPP